MVDNSNYLSTPDNYATPSQIKSMQDYARALMSGSGQQPVKHWTQGVSNMVSALMGGSLLGQANQQERAGLALRGQQEMPPNPYPTAQPALPQAAPPTSFSEGPSAAGMTNPASAIASIESKGSGDYSALGPQTKTGDRAYGRYQVMGANIPQWTQEALGKPMAPEEFLASPQAQDAVFQHKFGQYQAKYGPEGAAKAWFAGEKGMNNPDAADQNGMTVSKYAQKFDAAGGGAPASAMAFSGEPSQAPAAQAIQVAASGKGAAPAASGALNMAQPMPSQNGQVYIDPNKVPRVPQYTREQVQGLLSNPWASESERAAIKNEYIRQNQPIELPYPGGKVLIDPRDPTQQQFIAEPHWGESQIGDIHRPIMLTPNGQGGIVQAPVIHPPSPGMPQGAPPGPRSEAAPAGAPGGPLPPSSPGVPAAAQNAPAATPSPPVQVASANPSDAFALVAPKAQPPIPGVPPTAAPGTPTQPQTPFAKFAANMSPPPGIDPEDWAAYVGKKNFDTNKEVDVDAQKKSADFAAKKYDTLSTQAQAARSQAPNVDMALAMLNDPNMHQGLVHGVQDVWSRFKAAALGDKYANAPNETFDKLMSGQILGSMKTALGGLGQVRVAEIQLLQRANANRNNTDASNRAVLEVSKRGINTIDNLDQIGQQYASGDEVTDPVTGDILLKANVGPDGELAPRHGLDVGYDKLARKYILDHPSFTPEEIKHYQTIFDTGRDPSEAQQPNEPAKGAPEAGTPPLTALKAGQVTHFQNGQSWTLGPDGKPQQVK
jgi:hypothetical protein